MLLRVFDRLTSLPLLTVLATVLALGNMALGGLYLATLDSPIDEAGQAITGDYAAFHTGAAIVASGDGSLLYDLDVQQELQLELLGSNGPGWQGFLNPPGFAIALSPLGNLPILTGLRVFALVMATATVAMLCIWRHTFTELASHRFGMWTAAAVPLAWMPFARTMTGAQNTPITALALSALVIGFHRRMPVVTGVALGLLTYKPQFAVVLGLALVLARRWKAVSIAGTVGVAHYLAGAIVVGWEWPRDFLAALDRYGPLEAAANLRTEISIWGSLDFAFGEFAGGAFSFLPSSPIAVVLCSLLIVDLIRRRPGAATSADEKMLWFANAIVATLLISPHTQYYDIVLGVIPVLIGIEITLRRGKLLTRGLRFGLFTAWMIYPVWQASDTIGVQPLAFVLPLVYWWLRSVWIETTREVIVEPSTAVGASL